MVRKKAPPPPGVSKAPARLKGSLEAGALTPEERQRLIAQAAYLRAAAREFVGGDPLQDWLAAEAELNALIERQLAQRE